MKKWEYKTLYVGQSMTGDMGLGQETHSGKEFEKVLNELGDQGWELVGKGMTDNRQKEGVFNPVVNEFSHLVFKREK